MIRGTNVIAVLAILTTPLTAEAGEIDELVDAMSGIVTLRAQARAVGEGLSGAAGMELERLFESRIDPLVTRLDLIAKTRIEQAGSEARRTAIVAAEQLRLALLDIITTGSLAVSQQLVNAEVAFARTLVRLDNLLLGQLNRLMADIDSILCRVSPDGQLHIQLGPITGKEAEVIFRPRSKECWKDHDDSYVFFVAKEYTLWSGRICEEELEIEALFESGRYNEPGSMNKIVNKYINLTQWAEYARCFAKLNPEIKKEWLSEISRYSRATSLYRRMMRGDY